jgi:hypothetical protein
MGKTTQFTDSRAIPRETCDKMKCEAVATVVVKVYTDGGPQHMAFCATHTRDAVRALRKIDKALNKETP